MCEKCCDLLKNFSSLTAWLKIDFVIFQPVSRKINFRFKPTHNQQRAPDETKGFSCKTLFARRIWFTPQIPTNFWLKYWCRKYVHAHVQWQQTHQHATERHITRTHLNDSPKILSVPHIVAPNHVCEQTRAANHSTDANEIDSNRWAQTESNRGREEKKTRATETPHKMTIETRINDRRNYSTK